MRLTRRASQANVAQVDQLFATEYDQLTTRTARLIAWVMGLQWLGAIITSLLRTSASSDDHMVMHPFVMIALLLGGLLTLYPIYMTIAVPNNVTTRHLVAACQMFMSGLLIHITGGRIETHFHVFGSLALLSLYLDWQVLVTATVATFLDHVIMGVYMPACLFGTSGISPWRIVEHVLWVVVFDAFLIIACVQSQRRLRIVARREADHVYQAHHDLLTGLGNRLLLEDRMEESRTMGRTYIFMALDLDKFKEVNDTLGHDVGDALLILATTRMHAEMRETDHLIRTGGDEFALMLTDCSEMAQAEEIASRIVISLNKPFSWKGHTIHIGVSIGICLNKESALSNDEVRSNADLALYKIKNTGRNHYLVFNSALREETLHNMSLENRLRNAVATESLHLHYQPIVSTKGMLLGFEALLRWHDSVHGDVSPSDFVPIAERCGLIITLGEWVLRSACTQAAEWHQADNRLVKMSVNVSSTQLASDDFVGTVLRALKDSGLPPHMLDLELTESTLITEHMEALGALELLSKVGVRLSIDDFGTGYSSLSYLRDLPVHTLKIDRAFVKDIATSEESRLLIQGMIDMAHTLKLRVVAEGVETKYQLEVLEQAGCDEIQGFHVSCAVSSLGAQRFLQQATKVKKQETRSTVWEMPRRYANSR